MSQTRGGVASADGTSGQHGQVRAKGTFPCSMTMGFIGVVKFCLEVKLIKLSLKWFSFKCHQHF